jgi:hypothetical protein
MFSRQHYAKYFCQQNEVEVGMGDGLLEPG